MKRIIILEKMGDCLRQFWKLPELEYPDNYDDLMTLINMLENQNVIRVARYNKEGATIIPWLFNDDLYEEDGMMPKSPEEVFPFPIRDIRSEEDFKYYNEWLQTFFKQHVTSMCKNSKFVDNGWEKIDYRNIPTFNPTVVNMTQYSLDRLQYLSNMYDDEALYE